MRENTLHIVDTDASWNLAACSMNESWISLLLTHKRGFDAEIFDEFRTEGLVKHCRVHDWAHHGCLDTEVEAVSDDKTWLTGTQERRSGIRIKGLNPGFLLQATATMGRRQR